MQDFAGYDVDGLEYGYMSYPTKIGQTVQHEEDLDFKNIYVALDVSTDIPTLNSDGRYSPFSLYAIAPD